MAQMWNMWKRGTRLNTEKFYVFHSATSGGVYETEALLSYIHRA